MHQIITEPIAGDTRVSTSRVSAYTSSVSAYTSSVNVYTSHVSIYIVM